MSFRAPLQQWKPPTGWFFVVIPPEHALPATHPWGRTPVTATVDGHRWETSTWRDKKHGATLIVPTAVRAGRPAGAELEVAIEPRALFDEPPPRRRRR